MDEPKKKKVIVGKAPLELNYLESEGISVMVHNSQKINIKKINGKSLDTSVDVIFDVDEIRTTHYGDNNPEYVKKIDDCELILLNEVSRRRFNAEVGTEAMITYILPKED
jgi:hypothetical protein